MCLQGNKRKDDSEKWIVLKLKFNWFFLLLTCMTWGSNYIGVIPTNHAFIINPTASTLNITHEDIEPGLEQSELFYSISYVILFTGYAVAAVSVGLLFNLIPTWYLLFTSSLSLIIGYLLYAVATNGWMMILARYLAGVHLGIVESSTFPYYSHTYEIYINSLKKLKKYDKSKAGRTKGLIFALCLIGSTLGVLNGVGFATILAQFPTVSQFRPPAWYLVAIGVVMILLQVLMFHGDTVWKRHGHKASSLHTPPMQESSRVYTQCLILVPIYIITVGSVKGIRYVLLEVLLNPILRDSFGITQKVTSMYFLVFSFALLLGLILLYTLLAFRFNGYMLTTVGLVCTIVSLGLMTDWQAMRNDHCNDYSLFHHKQLVTQYRLELAGYTNISEGGLIYIQSLEVVEDDVYQLAVNRCQSAHCDWIPNSQLTGTHCSDCQPICRDPTHSLNFIQFTVGAIIFLLTAHIMYMGVFLLLSDSVPHNYQGVSAGSMVALMAIFRGVSPLILDFLYETSGKHTYLVMLVQVAIYLPLLLGLFLLYPWLAGKHKINYDKSSENKEETEEDEEKKGLLQ